MTEPGAEGEGKKTDNDEPDRHINFDAPAVLRKWPSLNNQRLTEGTGPYLVREGRRCARPRSRRAIHPRHGGRVSGE